MSNSERRKRKFRPAFCLPPNLFEGAVCATNFVKVKNSTEFLKLVEEDEDIAVLMGTSASVESCAQMKKLVNDLAPSFPDVLFIEADIDSNADLAKSQKLETVPTFVVYKDKLAIDRIEGAFPDKLKAALCQATGQKVSSIVTPSALDDDDLVHYIDLKKSEALNSSDATPFESFVAKKGKLASDCDEELILRYGFNQDVMLHSFLIKAPEEGGPSAIRVFINQLKSLDFDDVKTLSCAQEFDLTPENLKGVKRVEFDRWKFKKVSNIVVYIPGNLSESEVTELEMFSLFGEPVDKRKGLGGKKTEILTLT